MVEIKSAISFDEYMAIINSVSNSCFINDEYSPAYYEFMLRYSLIKTFAPDYDVPEFTVESYGEVWDRVMCEEADELIWRIKNKEICKSLEDAIKNNIKYRIEKANSLETSLKRLIDTIVEKSYSIPEIPVETLEKFTDVIANSNNQDLAQDMFNVMVDEGMLAKPNREIRRKNGQRSTKAKTKVVKEEG